MFEINVLEVGSVMKGMLNHLSKAKTGEGGCEEKRGSSRGCGKRK